MVHRVFDELKFKRTFVGGTKQRETELFLKVQGTKEDNSDCDWLEYRRMLTQYCDDVLNVILSWVYLTGILRYVIIGIAALMSFVNPYVSLPFVVIAIIFQLSYLYLKNKENKTLSAYNFSLDIILSEINKQTGLVLNKN